MSRASCCSDLARSLVVGVQFVPLAAIVYRQGGQRDAASAQRRAYDAAEVTSGVFLFRRRAARADLGQALQDARLSRIRIRQTTRHVRSQPKHMSCMPACALHNIARRVALHGAAPSLAR